MKLIVDTTKGNKWARLAQEHRCLAVGKVSIFTPISKNTQIAEKMFLKDGVLKIRSISC